ncbi:formylglycine-generating enzyme family protein [Treponema sp. R8-4-B8]
MVKLLEPLAPQKENGNTDKTKTPSTPLTPPIFVPDPAATEIAVVFGTGAGQTRVTTKREDGTQAGTITYSNGGYTYTYGTTNANYSNAIVRFKVNLGTFRLGDYGGVSFKWTGISGDAGLSNLESAHPEYTKNLFILASGDEGDLTPWKDDGSIKSVIVNTDYYYSNPSEPLYHGAVGVPAVKGQAGYPTPNYSLEPYEIATPIVRQKELTGEVWFSIYIHANDGSYKVSDFKLIPAAKFIKKDPPPSPISYVPNPAATEIAVPFGTGANQTRVTSKNYDGTQVGTITYSNGGYMYTYGTTDSNYGWAVVRFKVDLSNFRLGDYGGVSLKWTGISGDAGLSSANPTYYKNLFILASGNEEGITPYVSDYTIKALIVNTDYYDINPNAEFYASNVGTPAVKGQAGYPTPDYSLEPYEIATPIVRQKELTGEVWFSIYIHAENGSYKVSDFKLIPAAAFIKKDPPLPPPPIPYVPIPDATEIAVPFGTGANQTRVTSRNYDGIQAGTIEYSNGGYTYTYGTVPDSVYGNAIVRFKVDLGKFHLGDYGGVSLKWTGISGDAGLSNIDANHPEYTRNLFILASDDEEAITPWKNDDDIKTLVVNTNYYDSNPSAPLYDGSAGVPAVKGQAGYPSPDYSLEPYEIATPIVRQKELTGEVWFAIYLHAYDGSYKVSDFKLIPTAAFIKKDPPPPPPPIGPPPHITEMPAGYSSFYVDLSDWKTAGTNEGGLNSNVPTGSFANGKLTVTFTENNQRVNFKLKDWQVEMLKNRNETSNVIFIIDVIVVTDSDPSGALFRYHIGDPMSPSNWNATNSIYPYSEKLENILGRETSFRNDAYNEDNLRYFILQHRNEYTIKIEISSIQIGVIAGIIETPLSPPEMVYIPGGSFQMGSEEGDVNTKPVHTVTLSGFYMRKYEITQAQYQAVMGNNPSYFNSNPASGEVQENRPVESVSWYDAIVFCNKLSMLEGLSPAYSISGNTDPSVWGTVPTSSNTAWDAVVIVNDSNGYRLPTEAQWEYAAKGGDGSPGNYMYSGSNNVGDVAWYATNSDSKTHEVGKKAPNGLGLYDMTGNVYEWCWDWWGIYSSETQTDPGGADFGENRVRRGGAATTNVYYVRPFTRGGAFPYSRDTSLCGFRIVRPLD